MSAGFLVARSELRRRLGSLVVVALLVAVVTAAIGTALAGAHRTSTSVERFRTWANASDGTFQTERPSQFGPLRRIVEAHPETITIARQRLVNAFLIGASIPDIAILSDPDGRYGVTIDRPILLAGRMPRRNAPDEIILNSLAAQLLRARPGTQLTAKTWSPQNLEALFADKGFPGSEGPQLHLLVVGVARMLDGPRRRRPDIAVRTRQPRLSRGTSRRRCLAARTRRPSARGRAWFPGGQQRGCPPTSWRFHRAAFPHGPGGRAGIPRGLATRGR